MADGESPQPQGQSRTGTRGAYRSNPRGRQSRGRGDRPHSAAHQSRGGYAATPATMQEEPEDASRHEDGQEPSPSAASQGRRGRGAPQSARARAAIRGGLVAGGRRRFGGHLTNDPAEDFEDPSTAGVAPSLSAEAPEFVPGQPIIQRSKPQPRLRRNSTEPTAPKSTAPDLPTRIHEDISHGQYECAICTNDVLGSSRVWSCSICWTVLHLPCVKRWHANHQKKEEQNHSSQQSEAWRCPGCNLPMTEEPNTYHCWCGKDINPRPIMGLPPHSCGQTCSKPRSTCPHPCPLQCHAGPCPPCGLMGPTQSCYCGKKASTKRCTETKYDAGWSCNDTCGDLLPCGEHSCSRPCHSGLCGSCEIPMASRCYCGRVEKEMPCDRRDDIISSFDIRGDSADWFDGCFACDTPCGRKFDCGVHDCEQSCHPQDELPAHCPLSPDAVLSCPCGKTSLGELLASPRQTCRDKVPHCEKVCGRLLSCGHHCDDMCHTGSCRPCMQMTDISCRCGRTTTRTVCHQGQLEQPVCFRVCQATLNCGRHNCSERCCPGEKRAHERQVAKRKNKLQSAEDVEAEHICIRVCGRLLKCGAHNCEQICHKGPCPSCLEAVFDEIGCACGRTVLQPPQPCGTRAPECRFECTKQPGCGHPKVQHNCHPEDVACPKCPFLVEKSCICGKQRLKNQPCWFEEARCGLPCGKKLKCGSHTCKKQCHRAGQCEDSDVQGSHCLQTCGKTRKSCDHTCLDECHSPFACKENRPCQSKTFVTCQCQNRKQEVRCLATLSNPPPSREALKCDDECLRLQRNRRLADALNIDPDTHTDDHVPYSDKTLKLFKENFAWAQTQEREFRVFAGDGSEKRLRFKPMPNHQRAFLHALAEDFGMDSESQDPEPHRHVCIFKTPRFVSAPRKTLSQCVKIRSTQAAASAPTAGSGSAPGLEAFNSLLLAAPKFGLTIDEVNEALASDFAALPSLMFKTSFLPSEEVVIRATTSGSWGAPTPSAVEASLTTMKPSVAKVIKSGGLAKAVVLCHTDQSLNIVRREAASGAGAAGTGGWSAVVSRAAQKRVVADKPPETRVASSFIGLKRRPEKKAPEPVEEDWEAAAEKLDESSMAK